MIGWLRRWLESRGPAPLADPVAPLYVFDPPHVWITQAPVASDPDDWRFEEWHD